ILMSFARIRLKRLRLFMIGVTGSIGKTSTKEAVSHILTKRYRVLRNEKSYNTDFGLPLAILEQNSGFTSASKWLSVLAGGMVKAFFGGRDLQMMVAEMGVDKPGDMDTLLRLIRPQVSVMTNIKPVHLNDQQFKDLDDIFDEKKKLVTTLPEKGIAILNADDPYLASLRGKLVCRQIFYGMSDWADLRVTGIKNDFNGMEFGVSYKEQTASGFVPLLGSFQIYVILPALAVALTQGFELQEAVDALRDFRLPAGRMSVIPGIKESVIIDSSYNASPESVKQALDVLAGSPGRRIAVLGNMNELGEYSEAKHREIGRYAASRADMIFTVGEHAKYMSEEALKAGVKDFLVKHFDDAIYAGDELRKILKEGDIVLVKGSQNKVRLERLVKMVMRDPEKAKDLLVRQDAEWQKIG
ncbi:UDP-N-acetylmuramoyl-tripeptide--D-alanyl-D-alanine ligase, partial [Candidatus Gracilibacteria bacterium]|nr:UDP-N-acetylmuramoyl-tripeptide--D-alanyl-D-alanine ligase [Candidatus Gracilibacteria bacterium]